MIIMYTSYTVLEFFSCFLFSVYQVTILEMFWSIKHACFDKEFYVITYEQTDLKKTKINYCTCNTSTNFL